MKSRLSKVVHPVGGIPMVKSVVGSARAAGVDRVLVVVGHGADDVKAALEGESVEWIVQDQQRGTGDAVARASDRFTAGGTVLVLFGDAPLVRGETLQELIRFHTENESSATVLTTRVPDPSGYGRILRDEEGGLQGIVEHVNASEEERAIDEVNTGIACYSADALARALPRLEPNPPKDEIYLGDVIPLLIKEGRRVAAFQAGEPEEFFNVNDRLSLARADKAMRRRTAGELMASGVTILDPDNTYIDAGVTIGQDTVVMPNTYLTGSTSIGSECVIGPGAAIADSRVDDGCRIEHSVIRGSTVGPRVTVGPFSHLREGTVLAADVRVGNFAEIKNSSAGEGSKFPHHSYVGDSTIGAGVNIGAGVVTVNYDGRHKHRTVVEDGAFIGCNANLIAPVIVGGGAYVAAGSTVNKDVPGGDLAIARSRQENKAGWAERRRESDRDKT